MPLPSPPLKAESMERFNLGNVNDWHNFPSGDVLEAFVEGDYRAVQIKLFADLPIRVYLVDPDDDTPEALQPIAVGEGLLDLAFTIDRAMGLTWYADEGVKPLVRYLSYVRAQLLDGDGEESFTTVEPRGSIIPDEVRRLQKIMMINMERRIAQQIAAIEQQRAEEKAAEEVIEPEAKSDAAAE